MKTTLVLIGTLAFSLGVHAQVCFNPITTISSPMGSKPISVASADFNADGKTDVAIASNGLNSVAILSGNGSGGFSSFVVSFTVGNLPVSLISADFNADGKTDLATANSGSSDVSVLIGDGSGGFSAAVSFSVGNNPSSVISADFNGDGKADLLTANNSSHNVSVLLGDGLGSFAPAVQVAAGQYPFSVTSADFNADGKADLAVGSSQGVSILPGDGAGSFAAALSFSVTGFPNSIISADFNGDGKADLATANIYGNTVAVLAGNGAGSFAPAVYVPVRNNPCSLVSTDFNGDGKADLAVGSASTSSDTLYILPGNGTGSFSAPLSFIVGITPYGSICADLNADGKTDLVTANYTSNTLSVLLSCTATGMATFANEQQLSIYPNPAGTTIHIALVGSGMSQTIDDNSVIEITDMLGRTVLQTTLRNDQSHATVDVSNLGNGVYVVNVKTTGGTLTEKISVNR